MSKTYPFCPFQGIVAAGSAARRTTTCLTQTRSTSTSSSVSCRRGRQERHHRSIPCCSTRTRGLRRSRCTRSPSSSITPLQSTSPTPSVSALLESFTATIPSISSLFKFLSDPALNQIFLNWLLSWSCNRLTDIYLCSTPWQLDHRKPSSM